MVSTKHQTRCRVRPGERRHRSRRRLVVGVLLRCAVLVAACGAIPGVGPADPATIPDFGASNETKLDIGLFVNGQLVAKLAPGQSIDPTTTAMPPLPWAVEARSATGRVLGSTRVEPGGATCTPAAAGVERCSGALILVTLVCGRFEFFAGYGPRDPRARTGSGRSLHTVRARSVPGRPLPT